MAGLQFALSLQYLAFGRANSVASLTSSPSPFIYSVLLAHKAPVSGLEVGRPGLQGFLTAQRATQPAPSWVMVRSMRSSVNLSRTWSQMQRVLGPWSQAPRLDLSGPLSFSICKICSFFLGLLGWIKWAGLCEAFGHCANIWWMPAIIVGMPESMAGWRLTPGSEHSFRSCKGRSIGFPGVEGLVEDGVNGSVWELSVMYQWLVSLSHVKS